MRRTPARPWRSCRRASRRWTRGSATPSPVWPAPRGGPPRPRRGRSSARIRGPGRGARCARHSTGPGREGRRPCRVPRGSRRRVSAGQPAHLRGRCDHPAAPSLSTPPWGPLRCVCQSAAASWGRGRARGPRTAVIREACPHGGRGVISHARRSVRALHDPPRQGGGVASATHVRGPPRAGDTWKASACGRRCEGRGTPCSPAFVLSRAPESSPPGSAGYRAFGRQPEVLAAAAISRARSAWSVPHQPGRDPDVVASRRAAA